MSAIPSRATPIVVVAALWLAAAVAAGVAGRVAALRPPGPQLVVFGLTAVLLSLGRWWPTLRAWWRAVDLRALLAVHVVRLVGFYFLYLYDRGELPFEFAVIGGWGDIVAATGALVLLLMPPAKPLTQRLAGFWNLVALVDILFVVSTAARLGMSEPGSIAPLLRLPLSLLPTFLVPVIIATHVWIGVRVGVSGLLRGASANVAR